MNVKFQVLNAATGEVVLDNLSSAEVATNNRVMFTFKTRILKVVVSTPAEAPWTEREAARFTSGEYTPLPEYITNTIWWADRPHDLKLHYARMSKEKECMIAFVPNQDYGREERYMRMSPARYFSRYFGSVMPSHMIRDLATRMSTDTNGYQLRISYKQADFVFAYDDQPVCADGSTYLSCMAHPARRWGITIHPAAAYSTYEGEYVPDNPGVAPKDALAIAYFTDPGDSGRVLGRSVVWPAKERYIRIYSYARGGDHDLSMTNHNILQSLLVNAGFVRRPDLDGARIKKVHPSGRSGVILMPYIDGDTKEVFMADDSDTTLIIGDDSHPEAGKSFADGETTAGVVADDGGDAPDRFTCDNCGDNVDEDDTTYVEGEGRWCQHCLTSHAFYCDHYNQRYSDIIRRYEVRTNWYRSSHTGQICFYTSTWSEGALDDHAFYCDYTEEYYVNGSIFNAITVTTQRGGMTWCKEATADQWFKCPDCGDYFANDMRSEHADHVCTDCGEKYADGSVPSPTINDPNQLEMEINK